MSVVILQVFVTLVLVAAGVALFVHSITSRDLDHADRLSLLPLEQDASPAEPPEITGESPKS